MSLKLQSQDKRTVALIKLLCAFNLAISFFINSISLIDKAIKLPLGQFRDLDLKQSWKMPSDRKFLMPFVLVLYPIQLFVK